MLIRLTYLPQFWTFLIRRIFFYFTDVVSGTEFCPRPQVEPTPLVPRVSGQRLYLLGPTEYLLPEDGYRISLRNAAWNKIQYYG
jgi:hypothetical protein